MIEKARAEFVRNLPIIIVLLGWEAAVRCGAISPQVLPAFSTVTATLFKLLAASDFRFDIWTSLYQTAIGFTIAVFFGIAVGTAMARLRPVELALRSLLTLWYPVPVVALFPLLALVLKLGDQLQISMIVLGSVLPVIVTTFNAARGVDHYLIWSALNMGTSPRRVLRKIVIPAALPEIFGGVRITLALSFVLMVASQQLGSTSGLGAFTLLAGENGFYGGMFAGVLVVALMGFAADRAYMVAIRHALRWQEQP
jgi:ABC-type nitrate/sulfonate/bicarbonate transport system permease component